MRCGELWFAVRPGRDDRPVLALTRDTPCTAFGCGIDSPACLQYAVKCTCSYWSRPQDHRGLADGPDVARGCTPTRKLGA